MSMRTLVTLTVLCALCLAVPAQADEAVKAKARDIFEKNKDAVVWVSAVVNIEITGAGRTQSVPEAKAQAQGTVIDPSGLVVVSFSNIDPGAQFQGRSVNTPDGPVKLSAKSEHSEVKIHLPDGTELPARIVLKDPDLDLAFLAPDKPDAKLSAHFVKLEKAPKLQPLDDLVCLARMPRALDQTPVVAVQELAGIVTKPRTYFLGGRSLGGPVFAVDGTPIGITVSYRSQDGQDNAAGTVVLPAEDVVKIAAQALEAAKTAPPSSTGEAPATTGEAPSSSPAATGETPKTPDAPADNGATTKPADGPGQ